MKTLRAYPILIVFSGMISFTVLAQKVDPEYKRYFAKYQAQSTVGEFIDKMGIPHKIGRSYALIAGVSKYPKLSGDCEKNLTPAAIDVVKLKKYLIEYEKYDEVIVLENTNVTAKNLSYFLQSYLPDQIDGRANTRFLFAYSGHGFTINNRGYLLKASAESCQDRSESVNVNTLKSLIDEVVTVAHHSMILINSCYGGKFLSFGPNDAKVLIPKYQGAHAITAGSGRQLTYARNANEGSIFFETVISGLYGRANHNKTSPVITATDLYAHLKRRIPAETDQRQSPQLGDLYPEGSVGEFFFFNRLKLEEKGLVSKWPSVFNFNYLSFGERTEEIEPVEGETIRETIKEITYPPGRLSSEYVEVRLNKDHGGLELAHGPKRSQGLQYITYPIVKIGNQNWLGRNIQTTLKEGSICYDNDESNCSKFGPLYTLKDAKEVCPSGWHLPSVSEWENSVEHILSNVNSKTKAIEAIKSKTKWRKVGSVDGNGNNDSGLNLVPGGYAHSESSFSSINDYASLWTSEDLIDNKGTVIFFTASGIYFTKQRATDTYRSVRCLQD